MMRPRQLWHGLANRTLDVRDWFAADPSRINDALAAAGVLIVAAGVWLIYPAAAVIFVGLAIAGVGVLAAKVAARRRQRDKREREGWGD